MLPGWPLDVNPAVRPGFRRKPPLLTRFRADRHTVPVSAIAEPAPSISALFDLTGQVALVTGGSSGLGRRFAEVLSAAGATVVICARRRDRLDEVAIGNARLIAIQCDITDEQGVEAMVERVGTDLGRIDILVNNAGGHVISPAEDELLADFRRVINLNLTSVFHLTQLVGRKMLAQGGGSIVNIASIMGLVASSPVKEASYCASKGAIVNLTRELAVQWAGRGVRVNCIAPGWFPSELTADMLEDEKSMRWLQRNTPLGRAGQTGELDGALLLLAGSAGSFITGQTITVDGGWTAR
jgi:NAD(P)-dependent dehydrogenase (short-subunit alcohol dehydrogenase family)